jgi:uncharacterized repeat protein (TIGR03803 family)
MFVLPRGAGLALLTIAAVWASHGTASAAKLKTLYSFCKLADCADGRQPDGHIIRDTSGNLFGTTPSGGSNDAGTVFEVAPDGTESVVANICTKTQCPDGELPGSGVIMDTAGNLYGTALRGGFNGAGVVFELVANPGRTAWTYEVLYRFCAKGCADGQGPNGLTYQGQASGALYDGTSPLYGTTTFGGVNNFGVAFSLTPRGKNWKYRDIHDFCTPDCTSDGMMPQAEMTMDASGALFGTTSAGGDANNGGTVFALKPKRKGAFAETILYRFCAVAGCADGSTPFAGLTQDAAGDLLGVTSSGGQSGEDSVAFKLVPKGAHSQYSVLHTFCSVSGCADGSAPQVPLTLDASGNLFGDTVSGGNVNDGGVIFSLTPRYHTLYTFCAKPSCGDGANPAAQLLLDASGNLTGTTTGGGANGQGTVYTLSP